MPSDSGIRKVCENFKVTVGFSWDAKKYIWSSKFNTYLYIPYSDWEVMTGESLEELVVSWLLGLCFEDNPGYHSTNPCSEILLPNGPKLCTL